MKKLFAIALTAALMLAGGKASAQVSVGAGYLNQALRVSYEKNDNKSFIENGVYAGVFYDINEGDGLGVEAGLYYSFLTGRANILQDYLWGKAYEHNLNLPVNINYKVDLGGGNKGFIYAGPTFTCGLASTIEANVIIATIKLSDNYKHDYLNRFDIKFGGGLGYEFNDLFRVTVGYSFGILDQVGDGLRAKYDDGTVKKDNAIKLHRNMLNIGAAFLF